MPRQSINFAKISRDLFKPATTKARVARQQQPAESRIPPHAVSQLRVARSEDPMYQKKYQTDQLGEIPRQEPEVCKIARIREIAKTARE